ncbi:hypothetical protein [Thermus islandicus]|uniref:hypothetical protein n=1 Tax=Thermus islandicus TaxID=540988 RepID=UPI0003B609A3|nr:hypothetical protein [Thermus islandicus]
MAAFFANLPALLLALAFGAAVLGVLAGLLGAKRVWPLFALALGLFLLALFLRVE